MVTAKERLTLHVISAKEPKPAGSAMKVEFQATGPDGQTVVYQTFDRDAFPLVVAGVIIQGDVQTKVTTKGTRDFVDRLVSNITQMQAPAPGSQVPPAVAANGNHCESPDAMASIGAQVAFKGAIDLIAAKIINSDHPLAKGAIRWACARLPVTEGAK